MSDAAEAQASLEAFLKDEIVRMYEDVADIPDGEFHFFHGRQAAELFSYPLLEESGFSRVKSAVVPNFRFRKEVTQNSGEADGVKAVLMTAEKAESA